MEREHYTLATHSVCSKSQRMGVEVSTLSPRKLECQDSIRAIKTSAVTMTNYEIFPQASGLLLPQSLRTPKPSTSLTFSLQPLWNHLALSSSQGRLPVSQRKLNSGITSNRRRNLATQMTAKCLDRDPQLYSFHAMVAVVLLTLTTGSCTACTPLEPTAPSASSMRRAKTTIRTSTTWRSILLTAMVLDSRRSSSQVPARAEHDVQRVCWEREHYLQMSLSQC